MEVEDNNNKEIINKRSVGLNQRGLISVGAKPNPNIKTRSYKVSSNITKSIASGSVILALGIILGFGIPALSFGQNFNVNLISQNNDPISSLSFLVVELFMGVIFSVDQIIGSLIIGWFLSSLIASLIYGDEGRNGPIYSSILAITITGSVGFIMSLIIFSFNVGFNAIFSFSTFFYPLISIVFISIIIAIVSIPLIIIAMIGYKVGDLISAL